MAPTTDDDALQRLRAARAQFQSLVENIPAVVYQDAANEAWTTIYVSPRLRTMLGVEPEDWIGPDSRLWAEMMHPDDLDRAVAEVEAGIESGDDYAVEYRMIRPDGRVVWIRDEAQTLRDADGNPTVIQGLMYDITERKERLERQAFQARMLDSVSDAVISCDADLTITSWNRGAHVLYGWSEDEVRGHPMSEVLGFQVSDVSIGDVWDPSLVDPMGWHGRVAQMDKDGYEIVVETKGLPMRDARGEIRGYVMVNREVTDA
jgi:PAS domain S-box-containing protein